MSAIASFYLLAREDLDDLLDVAGSRGFHAFLQSRATALRDFGSSGYVFNDLDLILGELDASLFGDSGLQSESTRLSAALQSSLVLFDHGGAQSLLARWKSVRLKSKDISAFLKAEHGHSDSMHVEAIQTAFTQAQEWLAQVQPDGLGLLTIG